MFDDRALGCIVLYFDTKLLSNRVFYTAPKHTTTPHIDTHSKKYPPHTKDINKILHKLYINSLLLEGGEAFQVFQQIAVLHKAQIDKFLVAVEFKRLPKNNKEKKMIKECITYIKKHLSNVQILTKT